MREIKYKCWNPYQDIMHSPFTLYQLAVGEVVIPSQCFGHMLQYTGLKDCNGVEIYEGDLLESSIFICPVVVSYVDGLGMFRLEVTGEDCGDFIEYGSEYFEVVGNIYENPELLK